MSDNILQQIQSELKAPKGQTNTFGKYKYRSCEDIVEAVKPILAKHNLALVMFDDMVDVGGRVYVKATAQLINGSAILISVTACAREAEDKKGMDDAQITGAASSYARKYALNGLFCIDDTKDADATNQHGTDEKPKLMKLAAYKKELESAGTIPAVKDVARRYSQMVDCQVWNKMEVEEAGEAYHAKLKEFE